MTIDGKPVDVTVVSSQSITWVGGFGRRAERPCRVYWGSHGCRLERGHDGPHLCDCADDEGVDPETREYVDEPWCINVGAPPYYGPDTHFYGEDAEALGLPLVKDRR